MNNFTKASRNTNKINTLTWDIETIPQVTPFSKIQEERLKLKVSKAMENDDSLDIHSAKKLISGTNPFFGQVICIGIYEKSLRFPQGKEHLINATIEEINGIKYPNEKELIERWWTYIKTFTGTFIGFNTLNFDSHFIITRSMKHRVLPTHQQFLNLKKFSIYPHYDVMQQLCNWSFPTRPTLEQACDFFGVASPKEGAVKASGVAEAFQNGQINEIAKYCLRDVYSTFNLYKIVNDYNR